MAARLQMGLLIFSSEGKVERQMEGDDALGREQLRLRRPPVSRCSTAFPKNLSNCLD